MVGRPVTVALVLLSLAALAASQEEAAEPEPAVDPVPAEVLPKRKEWLTAHQSADGGWSGNGFRSRCEGERCEGTGTWESETGTTGLALLAFVGYGETHRTPRYGEVVRRAAARLMEIQDPDGCFGIRYPERFVADHAMAALAMAELAGLTQNEEFPASAGRAASFLLTQRGADGGWRAGDRFFESDAVTTCWAVSALLSARNAGTELDEEILRGAVAFIDGLTEPETGRVLLHRFEPEPSDRATAAGVLTRLLCGADPATDIAVARGAEVLLRGRPTPDATVDPEYRYLGTRACFCTGGDAWKTWNESMKRTVIDSQVQDRESCRWGSWDPAPGPSAEMGRVATTALGVLCLEVYYRYARVFGSKEPGSTRKVSPPRSKRAPALRQANRSAALDLDFPEPRTGFLR